MQYCVTDPREGITQMLGKVIENEALPLLAGAIMLRYFQHTHLLSLEEILHRASGKDPDDVQDALNALIASGHLIQDGGTR